MAAGEAGEAAASTMTDHDSVDAELDDRTAFLAVLRDTTFFDPEPGSTLALDDAALAPLSPSRLLRETFIASAESIAAAAAGTPAFALLRSALESAAVVIWLLESDDPAVRSTRLLSETWGDIRESDRLATALNGDHDPIAALERDWKTAHSRVFAAEDAAARQLPVTLSAKIDVAATVVADFTLVPNAAAVIRSSWQAFGAMSRGRGDIFGLANGDAAMIAGSRSLVLDVIETAASLYHVRAVALQ